MRISDWSSDVCSSDLRRYIKSSSAADFLAQQRGAGAERLQLALGHRRRQRRHAAVGAGDHALRVEERQGGAQSRRHLLRRLHLGAGDIRSEEHTSELQSLMRISYAVFCLKKKTEHTRHKPLPTK